MASPPTLKIGTIGTATLTVSPAELANSLNTTPDDSYAAVFATPRLVALMEVAGARLLTPLCGPGQLSVGASIAVSHTAATPAGVTVTAKATYRGREGKLFVFDVEATDPAGVVGRGVHKRAIIDGERLMASARRRGASKEKL